MISKFFSICWAKNNYIRPACLLNLSSSRRNHSYSGSQRTQPIAKLFFESQQSKSIEKYTLENMKRKLTFEEFKKTAVKSIDEFKKSPGIQAICGDDIEKISTAYNDYCWSKFTRYQQSLYGGNPANMV